MNPKIRIYDPGQEAEQQAIRRERAGILAGLAKLGSDVLGAKGSETATELLRQSNAAKRSA